MTDNPSQNPGENQGGYAPPPAYGSGGSPAPSEQQYPPAPQYGAPPYGAPYAAPYPYAPQKTNTLAIVSLVASLVGIVWILPFIGSLVGVITGHMSLNQLKTNGEKGRGLALAGTIVGWVGLGLTILIGIFIIVGISIAIQNDVRYGT